MVKFLKTTLAAAALLSVNAKSLDNLEEHIYSRVARDTIQRDEDLSLERMPGDPMGSGMLKYKDGYVCMDFMIQNGATGPNTSDSEQRANKLCNLLGYGAGGKGSWVPLFDSKSKMTLSKYNVKNEYTLLNWSSMRSATFNGKRAYCKTDRVVYLSCKTTTMYLEQQSGDSPSQGIVRVQNPRLREDGYLCDDVMNLGYYMVGNPSKLQIVDKLCQMMGYPGADLWHKSGKHYEDNITIAGAGLRMTGDDGMCKNFKKFMYWDSLDNCEYVGGENCSDSEVLKLMCREPFSRRIIQGSLE